MELKPFMEYASSYALYNWRLEEPGRGMVYGNLRLVRAFEGGLDPKSSEAGFVLTHVDMVRFSGEVVRGMFVLFWVLREGGFSVVLSEAKYLPDALACFEDLFSFWQFAIFDGVMLIPRCAI